MSVKIEALPGGGRRISGKGEVTAEELDAAVARANTDQHRVNAEETQRRMDNGEDVSFADESAKQRMERLHSEENTNSVFVQDGGRVQRDKKEGIRSDPHSASIHEAPPADNPDEPADQQTIKGKPAMQDGKGK